MGTRTRRTECLFNLPDFSGAVKPKIKISARCAHFCAERQLFSERLARAIKDSPLKAKEIAEKAGIDAGYLSDLPSGKKPLPSRTILKSLAESLNVPATWLVGLDLEEDRPGALRVAEKQFVAASEHNVLPRAISTIRSDGTPIEIISEIRAEVHDLILNGPAPSLRLCSAYQSDRGSSFYDYTDLDLDRKVKFRILKQ